MWTIDYNKKFAFKMFSDNDPLDAYGNYIETEPPVSQSYNIDSFNGAILNNTKIVSDLSGGEDISLDLTDRLINIIVDNSGSMSWNDPDGYRFDVIKKLINNISESYPGNVEYNIVKYGGQRSKLVFAGALSSDNLFDVNTTQTQDSYADKTENIYGVRVVRKTGSFPTSPTDGEIIYDGLYNKVVDDGLTEGTLYYYSVYIYDENDTFNLPTQVMILPKSTTVPPGIKNFSYKVLKGSSVVVDNVRSVWHFDEGEDNIIYDFTTFHDLTIEGEPYWLNKNQVPVGESGLRFNGIDNVAITDDSNNGLMYYAPFTFMGWIYVFDASGANVPIITRTNGTNVDWGVYLNNNKLRFNIDGSFTDSINNIPTNEWAHVAISIDNAGNLSMYINGNLDNTDIVAITSSYPVATDMDIFVGGDNTTFFHGYLCELSIHVEDRDENYISRHATVSTATDTDNGDRIVILSFSVPDVSSINSIDIVKNNLHIPASEQDGTSIYSRPLVVGDSYFSYMEDFVVDSTYNFRIFSVTADGIYSNIFDSLNLAVYIPGMSSEAFQNIFSSNVLSPLDDVVISSGNNKTYLNWGDPADPERKRTVIYYSTEGYPVIKNVDRTGTKIFEGNKELFAHTALVNNSTYFYSIFAIDRYQRTSSVKNVIGLPSSSNDNDDIPISDITGLSYEIIDGESINLFWDDPIQNRIIDGFFDDEIVIYAKIVDDSGEVIDKDLKVSLNLSIEKTLSDDYAEDIFIGETTFTPPSDEEIYKLVESGMQSGFSSGIFSLRFNSSSSGNLFKNIQKIKIEITPTFYIEDVNGPVDSNGNYTTNSFEYITRPLTVRLTNPFDLQLTNLKNKFVNLVFRKEVSALNNSSKEIKIYNGAYITSSEVFTLRTLFSYKNSVSTGPSQVSVAIYNADKVLSSDFDPIATSENTVIEANSGTVSTSSLDIEQLDSLGNPTGTTLLTKYADINIVPPITYQSLLIYVKAQFAGYIFVKKFFVVFANTLKIDLVPNVPLSDGINTLEQFANVYIVDPDNPDDLSLISYPSDNTLVSWTLTKDPNSIDRPIFSEDSVLSVDGVYSYIENGVANNVFIGPLFAIKPLSYNNDDQPVYEENILTASVIYDGVSESSFSTLVYKPLLDVGQISPSSHFLMELDALKQDIFSDGISYAKMRITHDASTSTTKYSECFRGCMLSLGKYIYTLRNGELIYISASDPLVEIIWGDVIETIDPYTGRPEIDTTNASSAFGSAYVDLSSESYTNVYFRIDKIYGKSLGVSGKSADINGDGLVDITDFNTLTSNIGIDNAELSDGDLDEDGNITIKDITLLATQWGKTPKDITEDEIKTYNQYSTGTTVIKPSCSCVSENTIIKYLNEITISGTTSSVFDGKVISMTGGGSMTKGLIPTILIPRDPLNITLVDKRVNGISVNNLVIDGVSENELIFDISAGGYPIEEGSAVFYSIVNFGDPVLSVNENISYCSKYIIENFSNTIRSYISVMVNPIPVNTTFKSELYLILPYDHSLSNAVNDIKITKIKFFYDEEDTKEDGGEMFSNESYRIDIDSGFSSNWEQKEDMNFSRAFFVGQTINNKIYTVGGINSNVIENSVEEYDPTTGIWTIKEMSPVRKFAACSIVDGTDIYVFGGIGYDIETNSLFISQSVEKYDTVADSWTILQDMPSIIDIDIVEDDARYGIAFGSASVISGFVYILCGIRNISFDGRTYIYNDRVLKYDILNNIWSYSDKIDQDLSFYTRFSPQSFVKNNTIYILGGATENNNETTVLKDSFNYNVVSEIMELSDKDIQNMPVPAYKTAYCSYSNSLYILGGTVKDYEFLKTFSILDNSLSLFNSVEFSPLVYALNGASCSTISDGGFTYLYIYGGIKSGKSENFLLIESILGDSLLKLNNKQGINLHINLLDESGDQFAGDIDVSVRGYIQSVSATGEQIYSIPISFAGYDVVIREQSLTLLDGSGDTTVFARSEDILNLLTNGSSFDELDENIKYKIVLQVSVVDDLYCGKNFIGLVSSISPIVSYDTITGVDICNNITVRQMTGDDLTVGLLSEKLYQNNSSYIDCQSVGSYSSDIQLLTEVLCNDSEAVLIVDDLETEEPLGNSPLESAIYDSSTYLSNVLYNDYKKLFTVFCDDEPNSSSITINEAIDSVLGIGSVNVPVIISNISFNDIAPSVFEGTVIDEYNIIASKTYGQSLTLSDFNFVNDYVGLLSGGVYGSLGQGSATYIYSLLEIDRINNLTAFFTLPIGSNGRWRFAVSENEYNYSLYSNWIEPNSTVNLSSINGKYIKFNIELFSGLNYNEYGGSFPNPLLTNILMEYTRPKIDYIFVDPISLLTPIKETVISSEIGEIVTDDQLVKSGISLSELSFDWLDFDKFSTPAKNINGKFIIPKRDGTFFDHIFEPLIRIDKFLYRTTNGPWDDLSFVVIFDSGGDIVDNSEYIIYPRWGEIVFKTQKYGSYTINIVNKKFLRIGNEIKNFDTNSTVKIYGWSYMNKKDE